MNPLDILMHRHSVPARQLGAPAPDEATLRSMLEAAIRVPDHGKLVPFRLALLRGEAKRVFGQRLAELAIGKNPDMPASKQDKERLRYTFAPLVVVVIARIDTESSVPDIEQRLSAGCVAYNLLLAAGAHGFGAQWLTGWAAYDTAAAKLIGLETHEHVIGFVHIGTPAIDTPDRERPVLDDLVSEWKA
jgi:nitroreductase